MRMKKTLAVLLIISIDTLLTSSQNPTTNNDQGGDVASSDDTPSHTHTFLDATCIIPKKCSCGLTEGEALGHKWLEATCKAAKTCSLCDMTEGQSVDHIVSGSTCKWCNKVVTVSPTLLKSRKYIFRKLIDNPFELLKQEKETVLFVAIIDLEKNEYMDGIYLEGTSTPGSTFPFNLPPIWYYDNVGYFYVYIDGYPYRVEKNVSNNHIVFTLTDNETQGKIELELLSNDTLRIASIDIPNELPYRFCFSVGDIFK